MPKADDTIVLPLSGKAVLLLIGGMDAANLLSQIPYAFCDISRVEIVAEFRHIRLTCRIQRHSFFIVDLQLLGG
jgi:hypothetical protein